jgi:hypothetical protein
MARMRHVEIGPGTADSQGAGPISDWGVMKLNGFARVSARRLTTLGVGVSALVVSVGMLAAPASAKPGNLAGNWESVDLDGSHQTLRIKGAGKHVYSMFYFDDRTSGICGGSPAKVVGRAVAEGNVLTGRGTLVCLPGGNPLPAQKITGSYEYDLGTDTLTDSWGVVWERV